jgi:hypothetical protein
MILELKNKKKMQTLPVEEIDYERLDKAYGEDSILQRLLSVLTRFVRLRERDNQIDVAYYNMEFCSFEMLADAVPPLISLDPRDFSVPFPEL